MRSHMQHFIKLSVQSFCLTISTTFQSLQTTGSAPIRSLGFVSSLNKISDQDLTDFTNELRLDHEELKADAVIAPAVVYQAGRADIIQLNARLFAAAKGVADDLKLPVYATVVLGRSVTASD